MNYSTIAPTDKGRLRWNRWHDRWDWVETGPYFRVTQIGGLGKHRGEWRVNRIRL